MDPGLQVLVDIAFAVLLAPGGIGVVALMSVVHKTAIEGLVGFGMDLAVPKAVVAHMQIFVSMKMTGYMKLDLGMKVE